MATSNDIKKFANQNFTFSNSQTDLPRHETRVQIKEAETATHKSVPFYDHFTSPPKNKISHPKT